MCLNRDLNPNRDYDLPITNGVTQQNLAAFWSHWCGFCPNLQLQARSTELLPPTWRVLRNLSDTETHSTGNNETTKPHGNKKKLKVHSVERIYLRQRCFDASKPRVAASTGAQYQYVGFSRRNKIPRCSAYAS